MLVLGGTNSGSTAACKTISLGGSTITKSINLELSQSATTQISMDDSAVRTLLGVTTPQTQISMSAAWAKGGSRTLYTTTFSQGYTNWTCPCTTSQIESVTGLGGQATAGYWTTGTIPWMNVRIYSFSSSTSGVTGTGTLDWSTLYNTIMNDINNANALGSSYRQVSGTVKTWRIWTNNGVYDILTSTTTPSGNSCYVNGNLTFYNPNGTPTSGQVLWSSTPGYSGFMYASGSYYIQGYKNNSSAFGLTWPGGNFTDDPSSGNNGTVDAAPTTPTTYTNVAVNPGQNYSIYSYGNQAGTPITISYYA